MWGVVMRKSLLIPENKKMHLAVNLVLIVSWVVIIFIFLFRWVGIFSEKSLSQPGEGTATIESIEPLEVLADDMAIIGPLYSQVDIVEDGLFLEAQKEQVLPLLEEKGLFFGLRKDASDDALLNDGPTETLEGELVYTATGLRAISSKDMIPVEPGKKYQLSVEAMSLGDSPSDVYIGLACYDSQKRLISDDAVNRSGQARVIVEVGEALIQTDTDIFGWADAKDFAGRRSLGFYFDGNTSHLPDYILGGYEDYYSRDIGQGAYAQIEGKTIQLNSKLPEEILKKIVLGKTVVDNHRGGGVYHYVAAQRQAVPLGEWIVYQSDIISGEEFNDDIASFRTGTRYVRIVILSNYYTKRFEPSPRGKQKQVFRKLIFKEVLAQEQKS